MRSSKSRSRGNKNRNNRPTGGNIINRVFDSSGPDGKVRGTPQQIIEKYTQLHRDSQLANDRVNAENFAQHAEHYTRMLAEAQREVDRAREEMEQQNRDRQAERDRQVERDRERAQRLKAQEEAANAAASAPEPAADKAAETAEETAPKQEQDPARRQSQRRAPRREKQASDAADLLPAFITGEDAAGADEADSGLVETPENNPRPARKPRTRKPRASDAGSSDRAKEGSGDGADAAGEDTAQSAGSTKAAE